MTEDLERKRGPVQGEESWRSRDPRLDRQAWEALQACLNLAETALRARMQPETGLSLPRYGALARLYEAEEGLSMSRLSRELRVSNANVTALADRLEREGWVERLPAPQDRRRVIVRLTASARRTFAAVRNPYEAKVAELFSGLSLSEVRLLAGLLDKLRRQLEQEPPASSRHGRGRGPRRLGPGAAKDGPGYGWV